MKQEMGWWFPEHELHLPEWMKHPKNKLTLNGRIAYQGKKQLATLKHCKAFQTAIDVGGHVGLWSYNLAHAFDVVAAFEPVAIHRECFEKNMAGIENIVLHPIALGDHEDSIAIYTEPGSSGNSFVKGKGEIPMQTLDSFDFNCVGLIKVDVEGFEEKALRGAVETIKRCKPVVIVEQKRDMAARFKLELLGAVKFLQSMGYKQVDEISGDHILVPT